MALVPLLFSACGPAGEPEARAARIDIYADRITYRTRAYETTTALAIGLEAAGDPPGFVELHDCGRLEDLEAVVDLLRESGEFRFGVALPDGC